MTDKPEPINHVEEIKKFAAMLGNDHHPPGTQYIARQILIHASALRNSQSSARWKANNPHKEASHA